MITSTTKPDLAKRRAGFTLVEVMIAASLGSFVLLGVLTTFLMLGRSGVAAQNYSQMESDARRGLEEFAQDIRMANDITLNGSSPYTSITLTMPATTPPGNYASNGNQVTYAFDSSTSGATATSLYQLPGNSSSVATKRVLVRKVASLTFTFFDRLDNSTTTTTSIKRVQISMQLRNTGNTLVAETDTIVSANAILRNKTAN